MVKRIFKLNRFPSTIMSLHREKINLADLPKTYNGQPPTLAIIGGTGLYDLPNLHPVARLSVATPWGLPSSPITISLTEDGFPVAFLARHGQHHDLLPTDVPLRANIAALKLLGVRAIVAFSAVGSLQPEIKPRDFVLPTQIIDRTKGNRPATFFERGFVAHAMFGEPFDLQLNKLVADAIKSQGDLEGQDGKPHPTFHTKQHTNKGEDLTVVCMEGPAFSTRAESKLYRLWGGSVINMSVLPEAKLAREAELAYQMICMSTDYDSWNEAEEPVTVETVVGNLKANSANAAKIAAKLIEIFHKEGSEIGKDLHGLMKFSVSTNLASLSKEVLAKMDFLFPGHWS